MGKRWRAEWPFVAALLLELLLFHRKVLFAAGWLFPWDFRGVHLPLATFVTDSLRRGEWPLWDPYTYCGNPIYANIQTALFYPPAFLAELAAIWLGDGALPRLLAVAVVALLWFAGVTTYVLARRLGASPAAAWIAATIYLFGCFFTSQAEHMGAVHGACWLPVAWLCVWELRERLQWRVLAALALGLAMSVLAGLPQVAVAVFGSALVLGLLLAVFRFGRRALAVTVLGAWGWALLLAAVQIIPTTELTRNSVAKYRAEWLKAGGGIPWRALPSLVMPNYWNVFDLSKFHGPADPTFLYLYGSLLGLALVLAAILWKPDGRARLFSILTLLAAVWMFGDSTPVGATVFQALPVSIRIGIHPEYTLCVFALGFALLAGLGAQRALRRQWLQIAAGVVIFADLYAAGANRPFNTSSLAAEPGVQRDSVDGNRDIVRQLRALTGSAFPPYRFDTTLDAGYNWSSTAPLLAIPTANGCDPMAPERIIQVRLSFSPGARWGTCYQVVRYDSPVLALTNARYVISRVPVSNSHFRAVASSGGYTISERQPTLPRYFLVGRSVAADRLSDAAATLHGRDFDPASTAVVEGLAARSYTQGAVQVVSYSPGRVTLRVHSPGDALLIASEAWYPGWRAFIDGAPARLFPADVAFRAIPLPPGDHEVEMRFVPRILMWSGLISCAALILSGVIFVRAR